MTDVVILDAVETMSRTIAGRREVIYINQSTTITAPFTGRLIVRAMGAAGGGAKGPSHTTGGNGGTVAIKELRVSRGDSVTLTIPAGGAAQAATENGNTGGTLTVSAPGWTGSIPGGNGGVQGTSGNQPAANTAPTGWDAYWLGGRGGASSGSSAATGGGGAALRNGHNAYASGSVASDPSFSGGAGIGGTSSGQGGGGSFSDGVGTSGGSNFLGLTAASGADGTPAAGMGPDITRLLLDLSGGGGGGGKNGAPGGGGGGNGSGTTAGNGGFGGGGGGGDNSAGNGGFGGGGGGSSNNGGAGGQGFITLEFLETAL